jgi:hypothetical protein
MILVYSDSEIIDLEWLPRIRFPGPIEVCHSFSTYIDSPATIKIAFTAHRLHCSWEADCPAYVGFEDKINQLSDASDLVFTLESELHNYHWTIWEQCHHDNVYWVQPGAVNDREDINSHLIYWGDWFKTTTNLYKELPQVIAQYQPYNIKPKYFDALLGSPKPHRDFIANSVKANNLDDKFIMTYGGQWNDDSFYAKDYFIYEPGTEIIENLIGTMNWVKYYNKKCHLSQIIPTEVYNNTAYSIVAETDFDNTLSFYSEKTVKPIIYKRLFVAFSGYKFLYNLHKLGFKTFDGIIDESYDLIIDDDKRLAAAFEQVKYLCSTPQEQILNQVHDILEHNYNIMMSTDWTLYATGCVSFVIDEKLG